MARGIQKQIEDAKKQRDKLDQHCMDLGDELDAIKARLDTAREAAGSAAELVTKLEAMAGPKGT